MTVRRGRGLGWDRVVGVKDSMGRDEMWGWRIYTWTSVMSSSVCTAIMKEFINDYSRGRNISARSFLVDSLRPLRLLTKDEHVIVVSRDSGSVLTFSIRLN